jgi:hypothetical protein
MTKTEKVTITCSIEQASVISEALDLYSRVLMGQFDNLGWTLALRYNFDVDAAAKLLNELKYVIFPELPRGGAYYGIIHPRLHEDSRIAYDIHQVIRQKLAYFRKPEGWITVDFDDPMRTSAENLPTCEVE